MKKIIYITGESAQGKSPMAREVSRVLHCPIIHTDKFYRPLDEAKAEGEYHKGKKAFYQKYADCKAVIIEGMAVASAKERALIEEHRAFRGEVLFIKLENPNHIANVKKKYGYIPSWVKGRFADIYTPPEKVFTVKSYDIMESVVKRFL